MSKFIEELKRRNVIKATLAYLVVGWVLLQVASVVLPIVNAPDWVLKTFTFFLVLGLPIWIFFSWVYEVTPEGLKKTQQNTAERGVSEATNKRLNILILVSLVAAIAVALLRPNKGFLSATNNVEYAIAVLPFDDMSQEKDSEWFCDGMTEDILTQLSKIKGLKVISRTSTERYKNTNKSVPEIAAELGVAYVVEGSVRKQNDDVLITAQLISAGDEHVWAENYNEKMNDVFKVQSDVSRKIAQQLKISISPKEEKELNEFPTESMAAYEAFLKGRSLLDKMDPSTSQTIISYFEKAIELDPNYADAYAELGFAHFVARGPIGEDKVSENIEKALQLDPNSSRANSYKGVWLLFAKQNKEEGIKYLEKAIELNPNDAKAHDMMAAYYMNSGLDTAENTEKALYHINEAIDLDPFSSQSYYVKLMTLADAGRVQEAEELLENKKSIFSGFQQKSAIEHIFDAKVRLSKSGPQIDELELYKKALELHPNNPHFMHKLASAYDGILNDQDNYLKYAKRAYQTDSTHIHAINDYHTALIESGEFEVAEELRASKNYQELLNDARKLMHEQYYFYHSKQYKKSYELLQDSLLLGRTNARLAFTLAQLKDFEKLNPLMKKLNTSENKAFVFAILKQRDSMYYYLNKDDIEPLDAQFINSRSELDPYRNDPEFVSFLKKHRFPVEERIK